MKPIIHQTSTADLRVVSATRHRRQRFVRAFGAVVKHISGRIRSMANRPEVRNDKITVPQRLDINHVRALALQKAQAKVRKGNKVSDLQLGDSNPVGGDQDPNVEWSYSYQVVQKPGG